MFQTTRKCNVPCVSHPLQRCTNKWKRGNLTYVEMANKFTSFGSDVHQVICPWARACDEPKHGESHHAFYSESHGTGFSLCLASCCCEDLCLPAWGCLLKTGSPFLSQPQTARYLAQHRWFITANLSKGHPAASITGTYPTSIGKFLGGRWRVHHTLCLLWVWCMWWFSGMGLWATLLKPWGRLVF